MIVPLILLGVGLLLVAGTALYVAAEFSLVTVDRAAVEAAAETGDATAVTLRSGLTSLSTQLSGAQVGITVTTLALGFVMEPSLAVLIRDPLQSWGVPTGLADTVGAVLALAVATVLSMVLGELVPKNFALTDPMATARAVIRPMRFSTMVFRPLIWVLNGIANAVLRVVGISPQEELRSARSAEELLSLVDRSAAEGTLARPTAGLLSRSIRFSGKLAADVLTPRIRVDFVPAAGTAEDLVRAAVHTGHSRFPVTGVDSDDVVGVVHLKRAVAVPPAERAGMTIGALMVEVPQVPETLPLDDLLEELRSSGLGFAVVIDEYGGTAGILTLEDVVEELVGEITDEHDPGPDQAARRADGLWQLPGARRPDEIAEATGVVLPESEEYETVAGLLLDRLGRLPEVGDSVVVHAQIRAGRRLAARPDLPGDRPTEADAEDDLPRPLLVRLTALALTRRRIDLVQLTAVAPIGESK